MSNPIASETGYCKTCGHMAHLAGGCSGGFRCECGDTSAENSTPASDPSGKGAREFYLEWRAGIQPVLSETLPKRLSLWEGRFAEAYADSLHQQVAALKLCLDVDHASDCAVMNGHACNCGWDDGDSEQTKSLRQQLELREQKHPYHEACPECWAKYKLLRQQLSDSQRDKQSAMLQFSGAQASNAKLLAELTDSEGRVGRFREYVATLEGKVGQLEADYVELEETQIENIHKCRTAKDALEARAKVAESQVSVLTKERDEARKIQIRADKEEVWYWQGDEYDDVQSLTCPVVMSAETIRTIVSRLSAVSEVVRTLHEMLARFANESTIKALLPDNGEFGHRLYAMNPTPTDKDVVRWRTALTNYEKAQQKEGQ